MALNGLDERAARPDAFMVLAAGNNHTRIDAEGQPMGWHMVTRGLALTSLDIMSGGGQVWACRGKCTLQTVDGVDMHRPPFVELRSDMSRFTGIYYVGPFTASLPAISAVAPQPR
jgi:hypothetical protein